jgi:Lon protease-like protein
MTRIDYDAEAATSERRPPVLRAFAATAMLIIPGFLAAQSGAATLPVEIALFPLPDVALFPNSTQPFHIFEPRYRAMVADALAGDSIIGMVALRPGFEAQYEGRPPVYAVGCAGIIIASEELPDGRYNIVLRAVSKFRILGESDTRAYRVANVEAVAETDEDGDGVPLAERRRQLEAAVLGAFPGAPLPPAALSDQEMVDALSLVLPMQPADRQQLLEAEGPLERASGLARQLRRGPRSSL